MGAVHHPGRAARAVPPREGTCMALYWTGLDGWPGELHWWGLSKPLERVEQVAELKSVRETESIDV